MRFKKRWQLYELINIYPKGNLCVMEEVMGWSPKKMKKYLNRLKKDDLIKEENSRFYPTPCRELINWDEFNKLKYKAIKYCSFYAGGDCMLYGSNDITESMKCEDINCRWKDSGSGKETFIPEREDLS